MLKVQFDNPQDFESHIITLLAAEGYHVETATPANSNYNLKVTKDHQIIAVQIKNYRVKVNVALVQRFLDFLESPLGGGFTDGWIIAANGFTPPAMTLVETERPSNLKLATCKNDSLLWDYPEVQGQNPAGIVEEIAINQKKRIYIGVFTCKGGVGKTTVSAHLGGAFALMGYDVILLDLDPDRNLRKLFLQQADGSDEDASIYVPGRKGQPGTTISVLYHEEWQEENYPDTKLVICDCSPVLDQNPARLVEKFDYCIIPTTLNPLGVSKNGDVIIRTFEHIRKFNTQAEMFALLNSYDASAEAEKRNQTLFEYLKHSLSPYLDRDPKCKLIDPQAAKIRQSKSLLFWGLHIIEGTTPQLGFREIAGKSHPRTDFLQLADYLQSHTQIDEIIKKEKSGNQVEL
jgi:chromosome partitioning protein